MIAALARLLRALLRRPAARGPVALSRAEVAQVAAALDGRAYAVEVCAAPVTRRGARAPCGALLGEGAARVDVECLCGAQARWALCPRHEGVMGEAGCACWFTARGVWR